MQEVNVTLAGLLVVLAALVTYILYSPDDAMKLSNWLRARSIALKTARSAYKNAFNSVHSNCLKGE